MGSVISEEDCPKCKAKGHMTVDCYYKTGNTYGYCWQCGYTWEETPFSYKISGGFGTYYVVNARGGGSSSSFRNARVIRSLIERLKRRVGSSKIRRISVTTRLNGRIKTFDLKGLNRTFTKVRSKHGYLNAYFCETAKLNNPVPYDFVDELMF